MRLLWAVALNATLLTSTALADNSLDWAFPPCPAAAPAGIPESTEPVSVAGSGLHFTAAQLRDRSAAPDWFPGEHDALPAVVAGDHSPKKPACGFCHLPDGNGRPENAKLAGLSASYIVAQVKAFHSQERRAGRPDYLPAVLMVNATTELTEAEIATAADYFAHQKVRSFVRVIERDEVPGYTAACFIFAPSHTAGRIPLGAAIVEMPTDIERFEHRDPHTPYVAYVPKGSIERGRLLARTGGHDRTQPCATCHGPSLRGGSKFPAPPLAGRFASYVVRQLYGFQSGARAGDAAQPMRAVVAQLTQSDMIDLAAYAASLHP